MKGKYSKWTRGDEESLLNKHGGEEKARAFIRGDFKLVPRDPAKDLLIPVGELITLSAVPKFVAKDTFTRANGIVSMGDNFKQFILPVVEENIPEAAVQVSELKRDAKDFRIAAELKVDERGELALAHFFQCLQRKLHTWLAAYVIGSDGETWAVDAYLGGGGWSANADRLGDRSRRDAGDRFLSR